MRAFIAHSKNEDKDALVTLKGVIKSCLKARFKTDFDCVLGLEDWERNFAQTYNSKWGDWIESIARRKDSTSGKAIYDLIVIPSMDLVIGRATGEIYKNAISAGVRCCHFNIVTRSIQKITRIEQLPGKPAWSAFYAVHTETI